MAGVLDKEPVLPGADKQMQSKTISCFRDVTLTGTFKLATVCPDTRSRLCQCWILTVCSLSVAGSQVR